MHGEQRYPSLRVLQGVLFLLGLILLLIGAAADSLRLSGSPGWGSAQISTMLAGIVLILLSFALGRRAVQVMLVSQLHHLWKGVLLALVSVVVVALAVECVLVLLGVSALYSPGTPFAELPLAQWWKCDRLGCRFDPTQIRDMPAVRREERGLAAEVFFERLSVVNSQGFHDAQEFISSDELHQTFKILILADSFGFGFHAPLGQSWVELLRPGLDPAVRATVWNTGIPGAATVQETAIAQHLLPIMRPNLVILGFYPANDLDGNLYPVDNFHAADTGSLFLKYKIGPDFEPIEMSPADAFQRATKIRVMSDAGALELLFGRTRAGSLLLNRWAMLQPDVGWIWSSEARHLPGEEQKISEADSRTTRLLEEVKILAQEQGAKLLLLLIPGPNDLESAGPRYLRGKTIVESLGIDFVEVRDDLIREDYVPADEHWNAAGHAKVGRLMTEYTGRYMSQTGCSER